MVLATDQCGSRRIKNKTLIRFYPTLSVAQIELFTPGSVRNYE